MATPTFHIGKLKRVEERCRRAVDSTSPDSWVLDHREVPDTIVWRLTQGQRTVAIIIGYRNDLLEPIEAELRSRIFSVRQRA